MSEPLQLTDADRVEIERIYDWAWNTTATHEAIARHFLAAGLERAAVICEEQGQKHFVKFSVQTSMANKCADAIRAAKGQT